MSGIALRPASAADMGAVLELLREASLPVDDLSRPGLVHLWVASNGGPPVGAVGLERYGDTALLRSLVVAPELRHGGVGARLVAAAEREARAAGVHQLVLLTQTAQRFFERLGYSVVERDSVPELVRSSGEFRSLCPATAVCMTRFLDGEMPGASHG